MGSKEEKSSPRTRVFAMSRAITRREKEASLKEGFPIHSTRHQKGMKTLMKSSQHVLWVMATPVTKKKQRKLHRQPLDMDQGSSVGSTETARFFG